MKVFVSGATGVLGRRAVARLVRDGHTVTGVARSADRDDLLRTLGATPVAVDPFDATGVTAAVAGHDAVCNLATHIPAASRMTMPGAWKENDRVRTEASGVLVNAAIAAGVGTFVQESISFGYVDNGDQWIDESNAVDPVAQVRSAVVSEANTARLTAAGGRGVVLRFGLFYGPDSDMTQLMARLARMRVAAMPGPGQYLSSITTDDAAGAVVAALGAPAGIYNADDDEPLLRRDYFAALSAALGTKPCRFLPRSMAFMGGKGLTALMRSQRVSNGKLKAATGWAPSWPSAYQGWPEVLKEMPKR